MQRSVGVTLSALLVFTISVVPLTFGALSVLSFFRPPSMPFPGVLVFRAMITVMGVVALGIASWGIASGVGLIRRLRWARTSMLVFGALMVFFSLPPMVILPFLHMPAQINGYPTNFGLASRVALASWFAVFAGLGVFWVYFFNRQSVKAQFKIAAAS